MLIVIEGPDGCGKTVQSKRLAKKLGFLWRCFPDRGTPIGQLIDGYLKDTWRVTDLHGDQPSEPGLNGLVFQALQLANRTEHLVKLERATMGVEGWDLVLDRYWGSGYAYGKLDGIDPAYLLSMHAGLPRPHLNVLIDVPVASLMRRMEARGAPRERYEDAAKLALLRDNYLDLWGQHAGDPQWVKVDGDRREDEVAEQLHGLALRARG